MKRLMLVFALIVSVAIVSPMTVSAQEQTVSLQICDMSIQIPSDWSTWVDCDLNVETAVVAYDQDLVSMLTGVNSVAAVEFMTYYQAMEPMMVAVAVDPILSDEQIMTTTVVAWFPLTAMLEQANLSADDYQGFYDAMEYTPSVNNGVWSAFGTGLEANTVYTNGLYIVPEEDLMVAILGRMGLSQSSHLAVVETAGKSLVFGDEAVTSTQIPFGGRPAGLDTKAEAAQSGFDTVTDVNDMDNPMVVPAFGVSGSFELTEYGENCSGYVSDVPDISVEVNVTAPLLVIGMTPGPELDFGLVVLTPSGEILCADNGSMIDQFGTIDTDKYKDPMIGVTLGINGTYKVWVSVPEPNLTYMAVVGFNTETGE